MRLRFAGMLLCLFFFCWFLAGCGGGSDVGNPYLPVTGSVTSRQSDGAKAQGARVVLARRGADPGFTTGAVIVPAGDFTVTVRALYFDTTYTDINGTFSFDSIPPGNYTLVATYKDLATLNYIEQRAGQEQFVSMVVTDPVTVSLKNYVTIDTGAEHFIAARIAGTEYVDSADTNGEITLHDVPAEKLDIILYRSDMKKEYFSGLRTDPGCTAELYTLPDLPSEKWTPHHCGVRDEYDLPYILENIVFTPQEPDTDRAYFQVNIDLQIQFSHSMDVLSTGKAVHGYSDGDSVVVDSLWWVGGNLLNIRLCTVDSSGNCRSAGERFLPGVTYGVTVDTTAQTALGVHLAYEAYVRFVPFP